MPDKTLLYLCNSAGFFLSHRYDLAKFAKKSGYDVHVATPYDEVHTATIKQHFTYHHVPISRSGLNPWREWLTFLSILRLVREIRPNLMHTITFKPNIYGGLVAKICGVPSMVYAATGLGYAFIRKGLKASLFRMLALPLMRMAFSHKRSRVIFQNPDDADLLQQLLVVKPSQSVLIRGSGVDISYYTPKSSLAQNSTVILPARMLYDKGVVEFIKASEVTRQQCPDVRFVLVGGLDPCNKASIEEGALKALCDMYAVEWVGEQKDMRYWCQSATLVCLPSYREGLPKALLEAASCGRALVATDVPGCREIVKHQHNGLLVPKEDVDSLGKAIAQLLVDDAMRASMEKASRAMACKDFDISLIMRQTLELYDCLLVLDHYHK